MTSSPCCLFAGILITLSSLQELALRPVRSQELESKNAQHVDTCPMKKLNMTCQSDEVIYIHAARFGRMKLGTCVTRGYGNVGCQADVREIVSTRCSGRQHCVIPIPDTELENIQNICDKELKHYLETSYSCIQVAARPNECIHHQNLPLTAQEGYIASSVTEATNCGGQLSPWRIRVDTGQKINLTLFDFTPRHQTRVTSQETSHAKSPRTCHIYAYLREGNSTERIHICADMTRVRNVHITSGNELQVYIVTTHSLENKPRFILKYEAVGCPNPAVSTNGWLKRENDGVTLGCYDTPEIWQMTCAGNVWVGKVGNCSTGAEKEESLTSIANVLTLPVGLAIALIISIAVCVSIIILMMGVIVLRRRRYLARRHRRNVFLMGEKRKPAEGQSTTASCDYEIKYCQDYGTVLEGGPRNEYAFVWDSAPCPKHEIRVTEEGHVIGPCACNSIEGTVCEHSTRAPLTNAKSLASLGYPENDAQAYPGSVSATIAPSCVVGQVDLLEGDYGYRTLPQVCGHDDTTSESRPTPPPVAMSSFGVSQASRDNEKNYARSNFK